MTQPALAAPAGLPSHAQISQACVPQVPISPAKEQIRRRRAADEILIAAIFGLSECEDVDLTAYPVSRPPVAAQT